MDRHLASALAFTLLGSTALGAAPMTLVPGETPPTAVPAAGPGAAQVEALKKRVEALERLLRPAPQDPAESGPEIDHEDQVRRARPQPAGPMRPRIVLDLDGNHQLTDLGPLGSGQDGVLVLGFASTEEDSPWEWLRAYDTNRDDRLDAADYDFSRLQIWIDANRDMVPRASEMHRPWQLGIQRIELPATPGAAGSYWSRDGAMHLAGIQDY